MSEKKYQMVACDIDGTLLNQEKRISEANLQAFKKLIDDEIQVVLISARMPRAIRYLQKELDILHMPSIAYNGGLMMRSSMGNSDYLSSHGIMASTASGIVKLLDGTAVHPGLYADDEWVVTKKDKIVEKEIFNTKTEPDIHTATDVLERWEKDGRTVHKIMLMGPEDDMKEVYGRIKKSDLSGYSIFKSKSNLFEITSDQTSKEKALTSVCNHLNIPIEQVVAIGDNDNDIGMIKTAGLGVAMGNGREELKKIADMVTDSNTDDGVAKAIRKLFF